MQPLPKPNTHQCPICGVALAYVPRYPRYVCAPCAERTVDKNGLRVKFFNLSLSGGVGGQYADSGAPYDAHECFIDGIACWADEAKFGGIVVEVVA